MATIIEQLIRLRGTTQGDWDQAVDTAEAHGPDEARRVDCEDARRRAMAAWDAAIELVRTGYPDGALYELQCARQLASAWGQDDPEREAIALLARVDAVYGFRVGGT